MGKKKKSVLLQSPTLTAALLQLQILQQKLKNQLKTIVEPLDHYVLVPTKAPDITINDKDESIEVLTSKKRYLFPKSDVSLLPLPATTSELLAKYIYDQLKEIYRDKQILVKVGESKSTMATYQE